LYKPIEDYLTGAWVNPYLSTISSSSPNNVIFFFFGVVAMLIWWIYRLRYQYRASGFHLTILLYLSVAYSLHRWCWQVWDFTPVSVSFFSRLAYADTLLMYTALYLLLWVFALGKGIVYQFCRKIIPKKCLNWFNDVKSRVYPQPYFKQLLSRVKNYISSQLKQKNSNSKPNETQGFFIDEPIAIEKNDVDVLGYTHYATQLAEKIHHTQNNDTAFAIGILGEWGVGKSSFIGLLKNALKTQDSSKIQIQFNPWLSDGPTNIVNDFFQTLQEKLAPYHHQLPLLLSRYAQELQNVHNNTVTQLLHSLTNLVSGSKSLSDLFEEIKETIRNVDRNIVIYIDDVDRLNDKEIVEIIRLIRNTANFPNVFFIVCYDRAYVVAALTKHSVHRPERFLEKIFQLELTLPFFDKKSLQDRLYKNLSIVIEDLTRDKYEINKLRDEIINAIKKLFDNINSTVNLQTLRDVTRLSNYIVQDWNLFEGNVDIHDLLHIELLRMKHPLVYQILITGNLKPKNNSLLNLKVGIGTTTAPVDDKYMKTQLNTLCKINDESQQTQVLNFIEHFDKPQTDANEFSFRNKPKPYANFGRLPEELPKNEFTRAITNGTITINTLTEWSNKYLSFTIDYHFDAELKKTNDEATIKNLINTLCVLGKIRAETISNRIYVPPLITALKQYKEQLNDDERFKNFIEQDLLGLTTSETENKLTKKDYTQADLFFCANFTHAIRRNTSYIFDLNLEYPDTSDPWSLAILEASIKYLKKEYSTKAIVDDQFLISFLFFFHATSYFKTLEGVSNLSVAHPDEAKTQAQALFADNKFFGSFLHATIKKRKSNHLLGEQAKPASYQLNTYVSQYIFKNQNEFEIFMKNNKSEWDKYEAYRTFYKKQIGNNNQPSENLDKSLLPLLNEHETNFDSNFEAGWLTLKRNLLKRLKKRIIRRKKLKRSNQLS